MTGSEKIPSKSRDKGSILKNCQNHMEVDNMNRYVNEEKGVGIVVLKYLGAELMPSGIDKLEFTMSGLTFHKEFDYFDYISVYFRTYWYI